MEVINNSHRRLASEWFQELQTKITKGLEVLDKEASGKKYPKTPGKFKRKSWERAGGGGGTMAIMEGRLFEKAGVNVSTVWGEFGEEFRKNIPGAEEDPRFWASGVSLVIHPRNPHVPIIHMNTRLITTTKAWFGGGIDLTPTFPNTDDTQEFHAGLKKVCDGFDKEYYPKYKKWCDEYFFLPHRNEMRGVGGIFYDYHNSKDWQRDFDFTQAVGSAFLDLYGSIVRKHMDESWTPAEEEALLRKRGRYAEFNLIYDRGTVFGLKTGGNVEAILMSLPPVAHWPAPDMGK